MGRVLESTMRRLNHTTFNHACGSAEGSGECLTDCNVIKNHYTNVGFSDEDFVEPIIISLFRGVWRTPEDNYLPSMKLIAEQLCENGRINAGEIEGIIKKRIYPVGGQRMKLVRWLLQWIFLSSSVTTI